MSVRVGVEEGACRGVVVTMGEGVVGKWVPQEKKLSEARHRGALCTSNTKWSRIFFHLIFLFSHTSHLPLTPLTSPNVHSDAFTCSWTLRSGSWPFMARYTAT